MQLTPGQRKAAQAAAAAAAIAAAVPGAMQVAKPWEGLVLGTYYDPPGILTACRGHTGPDVVKGTRYTLDQCNRWFDADMHKAVAIVEKCVPGAPQGILIAFGDAVYNMGPAIACDQKRSTAARLLARGEYAAACNQLPRWNKTKIAGILITLKGLTNRRLDEKNVCLKGL